LNQLLKKHVDNRRQYQHSHDDKKLHQFPDFFFAAVFITIEKRA
jgi:hypothetical protein